MKPEGSLPHSLQPAPVLILCQTNPVHSTPSYHSKIHLNIINPPMFWSF
jgi:hypothetical protein